VESSSGSKLAAALQQLFNKGSCASGSCSCAAAGVVDSRDLPAFMSVLLPGVAHKEAVVLLAWLQLQHGQGQQQAVPLEQFEAAARDLLSARELWARVRAAILHMAGRSVHAVCQAEVHAD
jgi:hypothetical protein